ncbi:MAG TPA: polysaccharide deacetylase family protein [Burkholderiales bacterium]|nr:polysaccharide deacetylase family protein [Burkholderiales bacterium]
MKTARAVPVLMYHHVSPTPGLVTITPQHFDEQMRWLAEAGYRTLGGDEFAGFLAGEPVADKSVLLTFDDGYLDNWVHAHPLLEQYGLRALLFVVSNWIHDGPPRPHAGNGTAPATPAHNACKAAIADGRADEVILRWSEVAAMREAGTFEFHSHTHTHTRWDRACSDAGEKRRQLADDLQTARTTLAARTGRASDHLCWPQGYFDADYLDVAHNTGFRHLYTVQPGVNEPGDDPRHIHRIVVKDRPARWLATRLWIYRQPRAGRLYVRLRGK